MRVGKHQSRGQGRCGSGVEGRRGGGGPLSLRPRSVRALGGVVVEW